MQVVANSYLSISRYDSLRSFEVASSLAWPLVRYRYSGHPINVCRAFVMPITLTCQLSRRVASHAQTVLLFSSSLFLCYTISLSFAPDILSHNYLQKFSFLSASVPSCCFLFYLFRKIHFLLSADHNIKYFMCLTQQKLQKPSVYQLWEFYLQKNHFRLPNIIFPAIAVLRHLEAMLGKVINVALDS